MEIRKLIYTVSSLTAGSKRLLAMDDNIEICNKRFGNMGVAQTREARLAYRELIVTTPGLSEVISGLIIDDETIRQREPDGTPLIRTIVTARIIPGIRADTGSVAMTGYPGERITSGLEGLCDRLLEYSRLGASFARWRSVIVTGDALPSNACIEANAHAMAEFSAVCQEFGLVPVVEPAVYVSGQETLEQSSFVTAQLLQTLFDALTAHKVLLDGLILMPTMVLPGLKCPTQKTAHEVVDATVRCLSQTVPAAVPGIVFSPGVETDELNSTRLNLMNIKFGPQLPWVLTRCFGSAARQAALRIWRGEKTNVHAAQQSFYQLVRSDQAARKTDYHAATQNDWYPDSPSQTETERRVI